MQESFPVVSYWLTEGLELDGRRSRASWHIEESRKDIGAVAIKWRSRVRKGVTPKVALYGSPINGGGRTGRKARPSDDESSLRIRYRILITERVNHKAAYPLRP